MPIYVYKNLETDYYYELKQSINDAPLTHHPETGEAIKRTPNLVNFILKGRGWASKKGKK